MNSQKMRKLILFYKLLTRYFVNAQDRVIQTAVPFISLGWMPGLAGMVDIGSCYISRCFFATMESSKMALLQTGSAKDFP
jgi:hypothetical protein